jgi:NADPH2:quinone reductase
MKAIRVHELGGPEALRFEDIPDPAPGEGQALVA